VFCGHANSGVFSAALIDGAALDISFISVAFYRTHCSRGAVLLFQMSVPAAGWVTGAAL
jgi:hypothetical protein